ncbi:MAG TPA: FHA domain-containing protein, partial [Anaeromyxobacteraceae bacterium]|nr:FHA domain-containing protein [Anaeromyxobacteraceae bacterium]
MARRIAIAAAGPEPGGTRALAGALVRSAAAGAAPATAPHLLVRTGPRAGARVPLRPALTLGRGRDADVALPDPKASRVHARVAVGAASVTVEDLASKNGLRVNGER